MSPVPLPWFDTGITVFYEHSGRARLKSRVGNQVEFGDWRLQWQTDLGSPIVDCGGGVFEQDRILNLFIVSGANPGEPIHEIARVTGCSPIDWSSEYTYTETGGPFRLGAAIETPSSYSGQFLGQRLLLGLFRDEDTEFTITWAGFTRSGVYGSPPVSPGGTPQGPEYLMKGFRFAIDSSVDTNAVEMQFRGLSVNGALVDVAGLADAFMTGISAGNVDAYTLDAGVPLWEHTAWPNYQWALNLDARDSGDNPIAVDMDPRYGSQITTPYTGTATARLNTWDSTAPAEGSLGSSTLTQRVVIDAAWAAAQDPPLHALDVGVPLRAAPKNPLARGTYQPLSVSFAASLAILQSANVWMAHAGPVVTSGSGGNTWTVSGGGAQVRRTLVEKWRNWSGLSGLGIADPLYDPLRHWTTKRDYYPDSPGQDVWSWGQYAWLEIGLTAPSAGTLTMTVTGAHLNVSNAYSTQPGLFSATAPGFTATYSVPVVAGANTVRVDLLFPNEGGPFYYGRVDTVTFSGMASGVYTLSTFRLVAVEQGYLKVDHDRLGNIGLIVVAQDGAFTFGNTTDDYLKDDEIGEFGGALPWKLPATALSAPVRTLAAMWEDLQRTEGFTATYSASASDAFLKDAFGTRLYFLITGADAEASSYIEPLMPHARFGAGATMQAVCSVAVDEIRIPNGIGAVMIYGRTVIGGVLEAQISRDGGTARAPVGVTARAVRTDTSATVASANADSSGYVTIPVRANRSREYRIEVS